MRSRDCLLLNINIIEITIIIILLISIFPDSTTSQDAPNQSQKETTRATATTTTTTTTNSTSTSISTSTSTNTTAASPASISTHTSTSFTTDAATTRAKSTSTTTTTTSNPNPNPNPNLNPPRPTNDSATVQSPGTAPIYRNQTEHDLAPVQSPGPEPINRNQTEHGSRKRRSNLQKIVIGMLLSIICIMVLSLIIIFFLKRRRSQRRLNQEFNQNVKNILLNHGSLAPKRYSYSKIKEITKSFNEKLGQGGYGSVYKGMLPDGSLVAVKILKETNSNGEEFINEVSSIIRTSHVNIVNLLGFCYERNKRALVYEFMPNKSLDKFITHGRLDWDTLYKIAIGVAQGLDYLHRGCSTRIVHFDIKPQNILLDEDFCPKISDFGLAKLCKKKQSIISVIGTRGTFGYIAPEVFSRNFGRVSHKSDVYSYGMMVLNMSGANNLVGIGSIESSGNYFPDKIYEHIIPSETRNVNDFVSEAEEEISKKMFLVGFWCIQTLPSDRPSMSKVVEMLEGKLKSIPIPPKPTLCSPRPLQQEFSLSESVNVESTISIEG